MLTTLQHQFAPCIADPQERRAYATHMCGLCHALGDHYGLLSRLVTSHELILLNLLTSAQRPDEPVVIKRHCPLNPLLTVTTNQDVASKFAATVAIELANVKFADDVQDSGGRNVAARLGRWLARKPHQATLRVLQDLEVNSEILTHLGERQIQAEKDDSQDPARPSAFASAELFATTARLAGMPENAERLAVIGANFGAYIYLLDAYHDFARDMLRGDYNPLRRFCWRSSEVLTLSQAGLEWLLSRFEMIQTSLHENVPKLYLQRHHDLLTELLCGPLDKIVLELSQRVRRHELTFRRWQWLDVLKVGLFVLPVTEPNTSFANPDLAMAYTNGGGPPAIDLKREPESVREREQERHDPCTQENGSYTQCYGVDCSHCGGTDCSGVDCSHCGGTDLSHCGGTDCSGVDLSHCGGTDCSGVDCSHCGGMDCSGVDFSGCSGMDFSGCSGMDCSGCSGVDCSGCSS